MSSSLKYDRIKISHDDLKLVFPDRILNELEGKQYYIYGAYEGSKKVLRGAAVFTLCEEINKAARLSYITVDEEYREGGIATRILERSIVSLKKAGIRYLIYAETGTSLGEMIRNLRFASDNGFIPVTAEGRLLQYSSGHVLDSSFISNTLKTAYRSKKMISLKDASKEQIRLFNDRDGHGLFVLNPKRNDPVLSKIYLGNDGIAGVVCVDRKKSEYPLIGDIFIEDDTDDEGIYEKLLAGAMYEAVGEPQTKGVVVQVCDTDRYDKVVGRMGEPEKEYNVMQLIRYI